MKKDHNTIEELLARMAIRDLSDAERDMAWSHIEAKSIQKNLLSVNFMKKTMIIPLIVILGLVAGAGGTAAAANSAKPGDKLFGVDQALERVQIALARGDKENDLRLRFAEERLSEIQALAEKRKAADITESSVLGIEADVFTNETIVKIETSVKKEVFTTSAKTKEGVVDAIAVRYEKLSESFIENKLDFEVEDRASRPEDKEASDSGELSGEQKLRIAAGLEAALNLVNNLENDEDERVSSLVEQLNDYIDELPENAQVKMNDNKVRIEADGERIDIKERKDGDVRIDSRTEEGRVRIEVKDGVVEVKVKDDGRNDDVVNDDDPQGIEEAEAKITDGKATVKVEINDRKETFTVSAVTREAIVAAIVARYPGLTNAQVSAVLKIENDSSDDSDDRKSEDEDKDDDRSDNSGRGSN